MRTTGTTQSTAPAPRCGSETRERSPVSAGSPARHQPFPHRLAREAPSRSRDAAPTAPPPLGMTRQARSSPPSTATAMTERSRASRSDRYSPPPEPSAKRPAPSRHQVVRPIPSPPISGWRWCRDRVAAFSLPTRSVTQRRAGSASGRRERRGSSIFLAPAVPEGSPWQRSPADRYGSPGLPATG